MTAPEADKLRTSLRLLLEAVEEVEHGHSNHGLNEIGWGAGMDISFMNLFSVAWRARQDLKEFDRAG